LTSLQTLFYATFLRMLASIFGKRPNTKWSNVHFRYQMFFKYGQSLCVNNAFTIETLAKTNSSSTNKMVAA